MPINSYIENIAKRYALGNATEHTFRGDLQHLIEELVPEIAATNEPKRIDCGAPDYVITRKDIPVGYIEAKDVGKDLEAKDLKEQFDRYRDALDNLVITDYLDFRFYINSERTHSIRIAEIRGGKIVALRDTFDQFTSLIKEFCSRTPQTIKSSKKLAEMMAEKAKILAFIIKNALDEDIAAGIESDLTNQMKAFKDILIHDIDAKSFADIYAQTIAYGMFAARLHDDSLDTFSRQEAAEKIPKTNPFLRKLFQFIAAFDLDTRIDWIVDALADLFRAADIAAILKNFGKSTQTHDPIMHFYETFLAEYDPKLRKSRGVFYTPEPVVDFIVRAVDDILKTEFNLSNGLADTSKTTIKVKVPVVEKKGKGTIYKEVDQEVHKVQILDPATGTGTFLATVIKHIYKGFENQQGVWNQYVDEHLIPRLNGFELLMASYAMAHLKLDLLLTELSDGTSLKGTEIIAQGKAEGRNPGYSVRQNTDPEGVEQTAHDVAPLQGASAVGKPSPGFHPGLLSSSPSGTRDQRFQIYLTNALEEYHPDTGTLFASWLSTEANEANHIKRDTPVMVIIGNPPYSVSSSNKSEWIETLTADYKKNLNERNIQPLSDDYIKFIRFGQHFVDKNGEGILAYISNNSFVDGIIHRQMRRHLLESFDRIYILDLHGSTTKGEICPDGTVDQNVFDIMQGVSINIFVKTGRKPEAKLGDVLHFDIQGKRESKYQFLLSNSISDIEWTISGVEAPGYYFLTKDFEERKQYDAGVNLNQLFPVNTSGIKTHDDSNLVSFHPFAELSERYYFRPFDIRAVNYDLKRVQRHRFAVMKHMLKPNISLLLPRQAITGLFGFFVSNGLNDINYTGTAGQFGAGLTFPLYLYPDDNAQQSLDGRTERVPNLNSEIVDKIVDDIGLMFSNEKGGSQRTFAPIDILDYIYAVLHSPSYREKYKEFLKIDFPRVPYPKDAATFWQLAALGGELRQIHLLESPKVSQFITGFPVGGDNVVDKPLFRVSSCDFVVSEKDLTTKQHKTARKENDTNVGDVYFNDTQYFANVPETAWNFYIGGYQPAQKWLKDRKGRKLSFDDIQHYQKIIVALTETQRLMKAIDEIDFID